MSQTLSVVTRSSSCASSTMIKSNEELETMSKDDLLKYSINISDLCKKLLDLEQRIEVLEGERAIQMTVNKLQKERVDNLQYRLTQNEKTTTNNAQYLRRRQLEVNNVTGSIENEDLTKAVASFLSTTGVKVREEDLDKCHRLKSNTTVIMEFKSRALRDSVLMARKTLKGKKTENNDLGLGKSFISESLCNEYHRLSYLCGKLKKDGYAKETWYFNGKLFLTDTNGKKFQIQHLSDIYEFATPESIDKYLKR